MRLSRGAATFLVALALFMHGCLGPPPPPPWPPEDTGGLKADDFQPISANGFDAADHRTDRNDYAWSMEYFAPENDAPGYVYVGTGNDIYGVLYQSIPFVIGSAAPGPVWSPPPEIRRYRDDLSPPVWETVLDYRDVEPGPEYGTFGFRTLREYRSPADAVNRLYAGTFGNVATLWCSNSGAPGSWQAVWQSEEPGSIRSLEVHQGRLYFSIASEIPSRTRRVGKLYAYDGRTVTPVATDGFGNPDNLDLQSLVSFNDWLYAGTKNEASGYEIWKLAGPEGQSGPVRVVDRGGPSRFNEAAITPCIFQGQLYYGGLLTAITGFVSGGKAANIIRINPDDSWETVVGPGSISGIDSGFGHPPNVYIWAMAVHDGWLYASTFDDTSAVVRGLEDTERLLKVVLRLRAANPCEAAWRAGGDLYKTQDGRTWHPITLDGFGDVGNYGFRTLESVGDTLYVGCANPFDGLEIWRGRRAE